MKKLLALLFIGLTSLYAQTVPSYVPTNGLVGWWPFNGNANDESGNNYNGQLMGSQLTSDRFGNINSACQNAYVSIPTSINWNSPSLTISGWIYYNSIVSNPNFNTLIDFTDGNCDNCWTSRYSLGQGNGGLVFGVSGTSMTTNANLILTAPSVQTWHHLAFTISNGQMRAFVNGMLVDSVTAPNQLLLPVGGNNSKNFGARSVTTGQNNINGGFDDIGIWTSALTPQQIFSLYAGCPISSIIQPQDFTAYTGTGWANFQCESSDTAATYQWQQNIGSGWSNLSNFGSYTGSTSDSLVITGVTSAMNNYGYRCIVTGCTTDTSDVAVLTIVDGIGLGESTLQKLTASPNPTNGLVSLNNVVVGTYELLTLDGRVLESGTAKKYYDLTSYPKGVYHLRLSTDEGTRALKIVKN